MAAKTPKKFRQARKAARADAKKVFSGKTQARLKDKTNPLGKFSADDKEALSDVMKEAKGNYITDDKGNKIKTTNITPKEAAAEYKRTTQASNEAFRSKMRAEFGEYAGKKATQADYDANPKIKERAPKTAPGKPAPRFTETGKVRSAVTATELKPQSYKVDKAGNKIKEPKAPAAKPSELGKRRLKQMKKAGISEADAKKVLSTNKPAYEKKETKPKVNKPATKGFAAGKELNAEGKAIYDKLVKEGVKPKSALNKALFRQEKGAKVATKAAAPIAKAAKSAAVAVKKQGPVPTSKVPAGARTIGTGKFNPKTGKLEFKWNDKEIKSVVEKNKAAGRNESGMTARQEAALQRRGRKEDQRMSKLRAADPKKFDAREALARNTKITPAEYAKERARIGDTVRPKPAVAPKPGKYLAMQNAKKTSTGKELIVRPKAGPVAVKAATTSAKKKFTAKGAALGAARLAGKAVTGKVGMAVTAASLLGGPLINQLTKDKNRITSADVMKGREQAAIKANAAKQANKSRSNQPRITGQGKLIGKGSVPTISSGGATSTYKVNAGDTLSGIAKKSGVSLSELLAANKKIKDPRKIYRNTSINIPSTGKMPTGGYTGPVPYRPKKK
jgi:LysM repeat protein